MDSSILFMLLLTVTARSLLTTSAQGSQQPVCDQTSPNQCINGACELQPDQQLGCNCYNGFIKDPTNPVLCHPIPPCNLMPGSPDKQCLNGWCQMQYNGNFGCFCKQGYQLSASNPNICENIDECALGYSNCPREACTDLPGDHTCQSCYAGYTLTTAGKCLAPRRTTSPQRGWGFNPLLLAWMWESMLF